VRHWRPDGRASAASNFHIRLSESGPRRMNVRMSILQHAISISTMRVSGPWEADVRTVEVESSISILVARASVPRLTDVRTVIFKLWFLPYLWARLEWKPRRLNGVSIFPYSELGKNLKVIDHWWTSGRAVEMSGRMQAGIEASRYSGGYERKDVFRTDNAGLSGIWSGWTRPPGIWNNGQMDVRTGWHVIQTADRESKIFYLFCSARSSENALTSGIPVYNFFIHKWFCPNTEWGQNTNNSKTEKLDLLHPSGRWTVQASSVQMTRTFHLDLPQCQEASNYTKLNLSERLSNTSGCRSVFDQLRDFFPKHKYGKTTATIWQCVFPSKRSPS